MRDYKTVMPGLEKDDNSRHTDQPLAANLAAFGEISLAGEIRQVSNSKQREAEAARLGFSRTIDSKASTLSVALKQGLAS